jgi:hypothetical protein
MALNGVMVPIVLFVMTGVTVILAPLARAYARRLEKGESGTGGTRLSSDIAARLERMEHAIDSIAIEVERISEGQRFTTKLLAERGSTPPPATALTERKT